MFIELFDYNVTLTKIIWRLDSRKSFSINKLIVRNNTIVKWLQEGKDVSSKIPSRCFVKQLLVLGNNSKPLATLRAESAMSSPNSPKVGRHVAGGPGSAMNSPKVTRHASPSPSPATTPLKSSSDSAVEEKPLESAPVATLKTEQTVLSSPSSPKVGRHVTGGTLSSPKLTRHASPSPAAISSTIVAPQAATTLPSSSSTPLHNSSDNAVEEKALESAPVASLKTEQAVLSSPSSPKVGRHAAGGSGSAVNSPKLARHASSSSSSSPTATPLKRSSDPAVDEQTRDNASSLTPSSSALSTSSTAPPTLNSPVVSAVDQRVASVGSFSPAASPKLNRPVSKLRDMSDSGSETDSPDSSKGERRRSVLGSLRKADSPSVIIASLEQNDPGMTSLNLEKNVTFQMKQQEYCARIGAALRTNTVCREINLSGCSIDSTGAKLIAEGMAENKTLRVLDLSSNKIGNDGSQAIAEALMKNCSINEINLLGQPGAFGESCLEVWLTMLSDFNISLRKIIWRLDSRKSFPINKLVVRNNTIKKFLDEGKDLSQGQKDGLFKVPDTANCDVSFLKD